ncbi:uncharacterized protein LOC127122292 [Lathyrus oleraceus]|uniref:uncharacterized protein LOC127122292 n=1 Tax=Pisum sativum TaxID=3888 RepID=UPI0021D37110|nr:uncharacterized protein LOC127122292 [Pisum sativum]
MDWLPKHPPHFMKRMRDPFENSMKAKKARLGESTGSRPPAPLTGSPSKSIPLSRSVKIKPIASSLPQTTPVYTSSETPPLTTRTSNLPLLKFNLATTTLPVFEAKMLNETTSPSSSSSPQSPPYYVLSSDNEPSDPQSPTLAQLQARALASQQPSHSKPEPEITSPPPEHPNPTTSKQPQTPPHAQQQNPPPEQPIHSPSEPNSQPKQTTPPPSAIPTPQTSVASITPTLNLGDTNPPSPSSPTSSTEPEIAFPTFEEAIKVFAKSSVEKIKDAGIRLQDCLARKAKEHARKEAEEKVHLEEEQRIREAEEKVSTEVAAAEAKAKAKAEAEEAACVAIEEAAKAKADALTQGEHSNSGFSPLVLKTLEELQNEQQVARARLDQQDSVNINIQNMLSQLLQRMPLPQTLRHLGYLFVASSSDVFSYFLIYALCAAYLYLFFYAI